ncbi:MAG: asparagine synthase (glutamine-hydrolyzing) [Pseudopedobacter saltans]|uniref:asparagine synthase (glutamine-hydrolyzing) n=1 Tax=Pseudopedobacter saltans TaxID=151895 RepID=A0A2W5F490_9SPHI|nr:MAG: asparagine synthase (glutamine-hydrolyzing) [Pseudopedobacter saltans]
MCGFSGIYLPIRLNAERITASLQKIKHRGKDDTVIAFSNTGSTPNYYACSFSSEETKQKLPFLQGAETADLWFGFNRLSIVDTSVHGMQPFYDKHRNCSFMVNGEIYNYKELRKTFLPNENFQSNSDSEVAFKLYLKLGDDFVHHLRGMFSIVVLDHTSNTISAWRDFFGLKPFFYTVLEDAFIFSSEINGIFATKLIKPKIKPENLAQQLYLGTSASPNTIWENIKSVPPASKFTIKLDNLSIKIASYWSLQYDPKNTIIQEQEFLQDLTDISQLYLISDPEIPKGIMISGGLDSGTLAHIYKNQSSHLMGSTIYDSVSSELPFARLNAECAHIELEEYEVPGKVSIETILDFCMAEEEPNEMPEATYFLTKALLGKRKVLFNALGPDELFYGYKYHWHAKMLSKFPKALLSFLAKITSGSKHRKLSEIHQYGVAALPFIQRSDISWQEIKELFGYDNSKDWQHPIDFILNQAKTRFSDFDRLPVLKQISFLDFHYYISSYHSFRADRPAMLNNIEIRFPFLDHHFVQKYFNLSNTDEGLHKNHNKPFFRKQIKGLLHPDVLNMPKKGFTMPLDSWVQELNMQSFTEKLKTHFDPVLLRDFATTPKRKWQMISLSTILSNHCSII